jgi:hypothetical protein
MSRVTIAMLGVLAGCSPIGPARIEATPASRMVPLEAANAPPRGGADVQLELTRAAIAGGHAYDTGMVRARYGVRAALALEGEAGLISTTDAPRQRDSLAGYGRAGLLIGNGGDPGRRVSRALMIGVAYGRASIGQWFGADVGAAVMRRGDVRPFAGLDGYLSVPFATTDLKRTIGGRIGAGIEIGSPQAAVIVGLSFGRVLVADGVLDGNRTVVGVGAGCRFTPSL